MFVNGAVDLFLNCLILIFMSISEEPVPFRNVDPGWKLFKCIIAAVTMTQKDNGQTQVSGSAVLSYFFLVSEPVAVATWPFNFNQ